MALTGTAPRRICIFGVLWIAFAPIAFLMAAIARMQSDITYAVQLAAFSVVAIAAAFFGVGAVLRHRWGAVGLRWISILAATYYLVNAGLIVLWPSRAGPLVRLGVFLIIAPTAVPFAWMAWALGRLLKGVEAEPRPATS